jgi:hypothetical protein
MSVVPIGCANDTTTTYEINTGVFVEELGALSFPDELTNGVPKVYTWRSAPAFGPVPGIAAPITTIVADVIFTLSFSLPPGGGDVVLLAVTISGDSVGTSSPAYTLREEVQLAIVPSLPVYFLHVSGLVRSENADPLLVTIESTSLATADATVNVMGVAFKGRVLN